MFVSGGLAGRDAETEQYIRHADSWTLSPKASKGDRASKGNHWTWIAHDRTAIYSGEACTASSSALLVTQLLHFVQELPQRKLISQANGATLTGGETTNADSPLDKASEQVSLAFGVHV